MKEPRAGIPDIHQLRDETQLDLDKVGVRGVRYPITVLDKSEGRQHTVATVDMFVDLPREYKGAHMSRFLEVLNEHHREVSIGKLPIILTAMRERMNAKSARIVVEFPYFIEKQAPVTLAPSLMGYTCVILGRSDCGGVTLGLEVRVPIMTLCPCSKEMSVAPHNQRGEVRVKIRFNRRVWIEDLVAMIERCASSDLYSLLKRVDEKAVADRAFENPRFVEDVVRLAATELLADPKITWFSVEAETLESIHAHNAYASIERDKTKKELR
jgi:GTP cyclohydrolase I